MSKTMVKRIGLVQRKQSMTRSEFETHWLNVHADLCKRLPGMRRYSVNLIEPGRFPNFPYDGFSELWFDSEADLIAALGSEEGKTLLADLPNFTDKIDPLLVHEHHMLG
ncbi:EthD family reductase [Agrobacterium tumefaciens]|uniref:EthD family reductase n=1 Tax=Agrobacterium tumefaciens TaxID=358 RepID=UPI001573C674|nr:EthD family reductase [Agrobacterium tumefaciens]NTB94912.1 EthD family reductase [Agrobacterium tumefaciens]NTC44033.1 EthD family reductase [Agrobacterium tumefaciens]